jgi:hypothetical protein
MYNILDSIPYEIQEMKPPVQRIELYEKYRRLRWRRSTICRRPVTVDRVVDLLVPINRHSFAISCPADINAPRAHSLSLVSLFK